MNSLGRILCLHSYGESHGPSVGVVLDGFPAGFEVDLEGIQAQLDRRRPGGSLQSPRTETDILQIGSGLYEGRTTGAPIHLWVANRDARPEDYSELKKVYRPGHADYTYQTKYGHRDPRGGGRSSARITAAWVAAGALAHQYLQSMGVQISSYVCAIGNVRMEADPEIINTERIDASVVRCPSPQHSTEMVAAIEAVRSQGDSLGGVIQTVVTGVQAGWGEPVFEKLGAKLGHAMLSLNAVKGFEVGDGFDLSRMRGSEANDPLVNGAEGVRTQTNHSGGIVGGISNGMNIHFRTAFKPTSSIAAEQQTLTVDLEPTQLSVQGRHDPCVVPRAVPIVDALTALVLLDALLLQRVRSL